MRNLSRFYYKHKLSIGVGIGVAVGWGLAQLVWYEK